MASYSASKWGIIGLMKSAALELGPKKITVNALIPGLVDTHRHTWQALFRNIASDWTLAHYFTGLHGTMSELYRAEDTYARLGWLLDPVPRHVYVYRPDAPVARLDQPETVAGDPVLPGFVLDLREIW